MYFCFSLLQDRNVTAKRSSGVIALWSVGLKVKWSPVSPNSYIHFKLRWSAWNLIVIFAYILCKSLLIHPKAPKKLKNELQNAHNVMMFLCKCNNRMWIVMTIVGVLFQWRGRDSCWLSVLETLGSAPAGINSPWERTVIRFLFCIYRCHANCKVPCKVPTFSKALVAQKTELLGICAGHLCSSPTEAALHQNLM